MILKSFTVGYIEPRQEKKKIQRKRIFFLLLQHQTLSLMAVVTSARHCFVRIFCEKYILLCFLEFTFTQRYGDK